MKPVFCFIDDSTFELDVFAQDIVPAAPDIEFVLGYTYDEVRRLIGDRHPCLFLLDLYGRDPKLTAPKIPSIEEVRTEAEAIPGLEQVFEGLEDFPGDKVNEFLKRLFRTTDGWRRLFYKASRAAGQSTAYGLANLAEARKDFPAAAAVGYTRKSLIMDAVEVLAAGADGLFLKPNGRTDEEIHRLTEMEAPKLIAAWMGLASVKFEAGLTILANQLWKIGLGAEAANLGQPEKLSAKAKSVLTNDELGFLNARRDLRLTIYD